MIHLCTMNMLSWYQKNNQHRFKDINMRNKSVRAYALPGNEQCIVKLLDTYLSLLPPGCPHFTCEHWTNFPLTQRSAV